MKKKFIIKKIPGSIHDGMITTAQTTAARRRDISNRENTYYAREMRLDYLQAAAIYQTNAIARNAVDNISKYIMKNGFTINILDEQYKDLPEKILKVWKKFKFNKVIQQGMKEGLVSGHALVFLLDKQQKPEKPLNLSLLKGKQLNFVNVDGMYITTTPCTHVLDPNYNKPIKYFAAGQPLHPTWCSVFNAITPTSYLKPMYKYMGMSYYEAAYQALLNDDVISTALPNLVYRSSIVHYKLKGFRDAIRNGTEDKMIKAVEVSEDTKSYLGATISDAEDTVEVINREMAGLAPLDERSIYRLSAAYKQPATILLGKSPDGMNATGKKDFEAFYNFISEWQEHWQEQYEWFVQIAIAYITGKDNIPFEFKFNEVNMVEPTEKATKDGNVLDNAVKMRELGFPESAVNRYLLEEELLTEDELKEMEEIAEEMEANLAMEGEDPIDNEFSEEPKLPKEKKATLSRTLKNKGKDNGTDNS